jgi:hypothetical protein
MSDQREQWRTRDVDGVIVDTRDLRRPVNWKFTLEEFLDAEVLLKLTDRRGTMMQAAQWALDNMPLLRTIQRRIEGAPRRPEGAGQEAEAVADLRGMLETAPSRVAVTQLMGLVENYKDEVHRLRQIVQKEDVDETAKRDRDGKRRYGVIERLVDAGAPRPPWLNQFNELVEVGGE